MSIHEQEEVVDKKQRRLLKIELISSKIEKTIIVAVGVMALIGSLSFSSLAWRFESVTAVFSAIAGASIGFLAGQSSKKSSQKDEE